MLRHARHEGRLTAIMRSRRESSNAMPCTHATRPPRKATGPPLISLILRWQESKRDSRACGGGGRPTIPPVTAERNMPHSHANTALDTSHCTGRAWPRGAECGGRGDQHRRSHSGRGRRGTDAARLLVSPLTTHQSPVTTTHRHPAYRESHSQHEQT